MLAIRLIDHAARVWLRVRDNAPSSTTLTLAFDCLAPQTDCFYIGTAQVEALYKKMVSSGNDLEEPKKVSIHATDHTLSISVKYE